ncbi:hypothetical protein DFH09DRAFT_1492323 [Mycena vulgaris]|nr:hypothetical protein DFH09DRAFT_1492323 [Mycena vulgaris]
MASLSELRRDPHVKDLSLNQIMIFTRLLSVIKHDIILCQPVHISTNEAPTVLPPTVSSFISAAAEIPVPAISICWDLLKDEVWSLRDTELSTNEENLFKIHGWKLGITSSTLFPPTHHCQNPHCPRTNPLKKAEARQVVVYTLGRGVAPAWAVHLYCADYNTNYHHNFSVQAGMRAYYGDKPKFIQIGEHQFVERKLVGMWVSMMLLAWVSATNCSRMYDMALSEQQQHDFAAGGWQFGCVLTTDHVWDAFVILTLLDYNDRKNMCLHVPHTGEQKDRFTEAMRARNREVIEQGQDEIGHCCNKCMRVWKRPDGTECGSCYYHDVQVVLGDGLSMGHIRCQVAHCTAELANNRHKFCPQHHHLEGICAIVGCDRAVVPGKKACDDPQHAKMELLHFERGRAAFTLRDRLQKHRLAHPNAPADETSLAAAMEEEEDDGIEWFEADGEDVRIRHEQNPGSVGVDDSVPCEASKSDTGNRQYKALFGRSRTHNEQSLVRPCAIFVQRATFFHAEAVSNVLLFVQKTFSVPRAFKPEHFIYDTNCDAKQQVMAHREAWSWFKDVGMTVDVFHFLHKHKIGHVFCQEHCNPANCPELMGPDGKTWFFNTSVAEQTNVWLGGYHSMCREMLPVKYNFFLDEMIRLRNQTIVA